MKKPIEIERAPEEYPYLGRYIYNDRRIQVNGHYYRKERMNLDVIEKLWWDIYQRRKKFYETFWTPWWNNLKNLPNKFWGYTGNKRRKLFNIVSDHPIREYGLNTDFVSDDKLEELYQVIPDIELPLHINDNMSEKAKGVYRNRCQGVLAAVPHIQYLVDQYIHNDSRLSRFNWALAFCEYVINDYLQCTYHIHMYRDYDSEKVVRLILNGRSYLYLLQSNVHDSEKIKLIQRPEDEPITEVFPKE